MNPVQEIFNTMINAPYASEGDKTDENGFLRCGKCGGKKTTIIAGKIVPCLCECEEARVEREDEERRAAMFRREVERTRRKGLTDPTYLTMKFENDDWRNKKASEVSRKYVEYWEQMKRDNIGLLFYGSVGAGKSFLAVCIANALIDKGVRVCVTSFPRLLNRLQGFDHDNEDLLAELNRYDLLVIDDLGVERNTPYALEKVYSVVDSRLRAGKPLIVTTNLSLTEMKNAESLELARIYDRILEMCPIHPKLDGQSGRRENSEQKREAARKVLGI